MHLMPILWIIWAALTAVLLVLLMYRGTLTRYEEDAMFLDDSSEHQHQEQERILERVRRIKPAVQAFMLGAGAMSAAILGMYVWDAIRQISL